MKKQVRASPGDECTVPGSEERSCCSSGSQNIGPHVMCTYMPHSPPAPGDTLDGPQIRRGKSKILLLPPQPVQLRSSCVSAQLHCFLRLRHALPFCSPRTMFALHRPLTRLRFLSEIPPLLLACWLTHPPAAGPPPQGSFPSPHRLIRCFVTNFVDSSLLPCDVVVSVCKLTFIAGIS